MSRGGGGGGDVGTPRAAAGGSCRCDCPRVAAVPAGARARCEKVAAAGRARRLDANRYDLAVPSSERASALSSARTIAQLPAARPG
mmetsp:Transcript_23065/g.72491  ORF Transcript_23065/g.72491 Transcript_23065/m.72491 type:complete len:86 (+) Transcript_23065:485-742(+)